MPMIRYWLARTFFALLCVASLTAAKAQNTPRIGYSYPAGGRQGTTFLVTIGGQFLDGATNVWFSGSGIKGVVVEHSKPLTQKQFTVLRDQLKELQSKRASANRRNSNSTNRWTNADEQLIAEIRKKLANPPNRTGNPAIAETVKLQVSILPNAEPGERELRLETPQGLSNPRFFHVGQLPEFSEEPSKNTRIMKFREQNAAAVSTNEMNITLPAVVNGQILPGGVDRFRFRAYKGQRLVVAVGARELIPYLPDAVPGWFQASVSFYDAQGRELEHADHFHFHPDPVLYHEIENSGVYVVEIRDSIYRGREDFVYRITLGELPFITSHFPLGGKSGAKTEVELKGWNLPTNTIAQDVQDKAGIFPLSVQKEKFLSNHVPFAMDTIPECLEQGTNDLPQSAQCVTLPININGRIERPGKWDVFRFEGRGGCEIIAEVLARRLNSPLDSVLKLTDLSGKQLGFNDDSEDKGAGLDTHHADSRISVTLPTNGTYFIHLGDAQQNGGAEYGYRLRISEPQPDFALRVVPSTLNVRGGGTIPLTVYALRKDGFTNAIDVLLKGAPKGFALSGGRVPAGLDKIQLTLTVPSVASKEPLSLGIEGRSIIQGHAIIHPAVPAEDMMQAFAYRHLVPAKDLRACVFTARFMPRFPIELMDKKVVTIPSGGTATVRFSAPPAFADRVDLELSEAPDGITIQKVSAIRGGLELVFQSDAARNKPGLQGNLIVSTFSAKQPAAGKKGKGQGINRRNAGGALPAIPFEIVFP